MTANPSNYCTIAQAAALTNDMASTNWVLAQGYMTSASGISADTATGIVTALAYPLSGNPSNWVDASITNNLSGGGITAAQGTNISSAVFASTAGSMAYADSNHYATTNELAISLNTRTDNGAFASHTNNETAAKHVTAAQVVLIGGAVQTNDTTYTQTVAKAASALQSESDTLQSVLNRSGIAKKTSGEYNVANDPMGIYRGSMLFPANANFDSISWGMAFQSYASSVAHTAVVTYLNNQGFWYTEDDAGNQYHLWDSRNLSPTNPVFT